MLLSMLLLLLQLRHQRRQHGLMMMLEQLLVKPCSAGVQHTPASEGEKDSLVLVW